MEEEVRSGRTGCGQVLRVCSICQRVGRKAAVLLVPGSGMVDRDASIGAT